ncbi:MAG TPA: MFS transporter [Bacillales bacterium]|nr:MFS transporter [Bacillales bacterium]
MPEPLTARADTKMKSKWALFQQRNFILLWIGGMFSSFGFYGFTFTEAWYIVHTLNLEALLGVTYIASSIPRVIFMMLGGITADRISRSKILFLSDLSRAILLGILMVLLAFSSVSIWTFAGLALFFGMLDAFFWPAQNSLLPDVAPRDQLTRANSTIQTTNQAATIIAPMVFGFAIAFGNYVMTFGLAAAFLIVSSALVSFIKVTKRAKNNEENGEGMLASAKKGLAYVKEIPWLQALMITSALLNFLLVGPLQMGLPLFVDNVLQGDALNYSFLETSAAIGMLIGAIFVGVLNIHKKRGMFGLGMIVASSVFFLLFTLGLGTWISFAAIFLFGLALAGSNIVTMSMIQGRIEDGMMGRVMGILSTASMGLVPVSFAFTSLLLALDLPINLIMFSGAALVFLVSLFILIRVPALRKLD